MAIYGAGEAAWDYFDSILGLTEDLLPVVSDPNVSISSSSKIKDLGKTPTQFDKNGEVVGISQWTAKKSNPHLIDKWKIDSRLGICCQTRYARGLDVDVGDPIKAQAIVDFWLSLVGKLPVRTRSNSGKRLAMFSLVGKYPKRRFEVDGGIIEFLGTGQQFIAAGTHPSGVRYEWDENGLPFDLVELTPEIFEDAWSKLVAKFAIGAAVTGKVGEIVDRPRGVTVTDPMVEWLKAEGQVRSVEANGVVRVICPWEEEHSDGVGSDSSTCYFPAGIGGKAEAGFKCLHAHCEGRGIAEYEQAVGYVATKFDTVEEKNSGSLDELDLPSFQRKKDGTILCNLSNLELALKSKLACGAHLAFDNFRGEVVICENMNIKSLDDAEWRSFDDADGVALRLRLSRVGFEEIGRELMRDAIKLVTKIVQVDTAQVWIRKLPAWDGVKRVERFLPDYLGTKDDRYTRAVSRYIWTGHAGRIVQPGLKCDMMPIFCGDQGIRKSTFLGLIPPSDLYFRELSFGEIEHDNISRKIRGALVCEFAEMDGLHSRALESVKRFTSRTKENWIPKFQEHPIDYFRRTIFYGTSNETELLADTTGNRRWLPVIVTNADCAKLKRDRDQLWAEGLQMFIEHGVQYDAAEQLAKGEHHKFETTDEWTDVIGHWLRDLEREIGVELHNDPDATVSGLTMQSILFGALGITPKDMTKSHQIRAGKAMTQLKYKRYMYFDKKLNKQVRVWAKRDPML